MGGRFVGVVGLGFIDLGLVSLPHLAVAAASFAGGRLAGQDHPPHLLAHGDRVVCLLQTEEQKKNIVRNVKRCVASWTETNTEEKRKWAGGGEMGQEDREVPARLRFVTAQHGHGLL